jgi:hypothetical protein
MRACSIVAQPPGKKNSSIQLLSGGEKALDGNCAGVFDVPAQSGAVLHAG